MLDANKADALERAKAPPAKKIYDVFLAARLRQKWRQINIVGVAY